MKRVWRPTWILTLALLLGFAACSDDEDDTATDTGTAADGGGDDTDDATEDMEIEVPPEFESCATVFAPSTGDSTSVLTALIEAAADSEICFIAGNYDFDVELSVSTRGITMRGQDGTVFNFAAASSAANAILATADDFTIQDLELVDMPGNGIRVEGAENVIFRNLTTYFTAGSVEENGAYAVFPVTSNNILVEDCDVAGTSDAGIYIGQSTNIIVRNNNVHGNVAGIEIENSQDAEVYGNTATDNTAGILVFDLPDVPVQDGRRTRVYNNTVTANNRDNFAPAGNIVAAVPPGLGIMLMAADQIQVHDNTVSDHDSAGILMVSYGILAILAGRPTDDPNYDSYLETAYVHDNTFSNNGSNPRPQLTLIGEDTLEDILWDGDFDVEKDNEDGSLTNCFVNNGDATFRDFDSEGFFANQSTDIEPHNCTHADLPLLDLDIASAE